MHYRVYLLGSDNHVQAAEFFGAHSDLDALAIGAAAYAAVSDVFTGYEVWRSAARISGRGRQVAPLLASIIERRQESLNELEEMLHDSFACVRRSAKLIESVDGRMFGRRKRIEAGQAGTDE